MFTILPLLRVVKRSLPFARDIDGPQALALLEHVQTSRETR